MNFAELTGSVSGVLWALPLVLLALLVGLYYSVRMRFPQVRLFKDMIHFLTTGGTSDEGISSFQGFAMALGGRIGVGNIAGVGTAIAFGGPGAVFWMWMIAFIGASTAYAESALAQVFKSKIGGEYRGGPAFYIEKGMKHKGFGKAFAIVFAISAIIANGFTGPTIQAFNVAESMNNAWGLNTTVVGVVLAGLFALVVFGGMKRIGNVAGKIVPVMAGLYILLALIILAINFQRIPEMFGLIFGCAFNLNALYGAIWGQAILWGVKRGIYSNEAGMGSGAHASAAAEVSHPAKQGLAQSFSVYVDTLLVCTATAIMILSTGAYNVYLGDGFITENAIVSGVEAGTGYTQAAIDSWIPGLGSSFIAVAIFFFAFTTLLSFAFYTDANINYIAGKSKNRKVYLTIMRVLLTGIILLGAVTKSAAAWNLADIGVGLMSWVNFIALILLSGIAIKTLKDYERQKALGLDPVFEPKDIGIDNAELWDDITQSKYQDLLDAKHEAEAKEKAN
ncbi:MAG: alanine:cation symporter family protein [Peptostreptococcaceae bacterium]|nr:alanine:cation symporter family protein [Peptostreptococcaceae bacterium]